MSRFDADSAACAIFTFKDGLLSAVAHDLELRVGVFALELDEEGPTVSGRFEAGSLTVVSAMRDGRPAPGLLSPSDRRKIEATVRGEVLEAARHPEVRFRSTEILPRGDGWEVSGALSLHGRERPLALLVRREGERWVSEVELDQRDFGIRPFTAMLGTLRIQPRVRVRISLPIDRAR